MRKLIVLAVVLAFAGGAKATVLTWSEDAITLTLSESVVVQLNPDDNQMYIKYAGNSASSVASIMNIELHNLGQRGYVDESPSGWPDGWWELEALDAEPPGMGSHHWHVTIQAGSVTGTHSLHSDYYGTDDLLEITVVPEPMPVVLLGIGGLGLLRKRRR